MAYNRYWISWKNDGDEHFPPDITWCGAFYAKGLQEALLALFDVEKNHTITEIVSIREE